MSGDRSKTDRYDEAELPEASPQIPSAAVAYAASSPSDPQDRHARRRRMDRDIVKIAWPAILSQVLASLVSLIDIAMLGRLGTQALAAVGYTTQYFFLAQAILLAAGVACVAMIARSVGAGETHRAREVLATFLVLSLASAIGLAGIVAVWPELFLRILNADPEVARIAVPYLRLTLGSVVLLSVTLMYESAFRAMRDTVTPMWVAFAVTAVKLGLNVVLIFGVLGAPRLELVGAGIATVVSQAVGVLLMVGVASRSRMGMSLRPRLRDFRALPRHIGEATRVSIPAVGERVVMNTALMAYFWVLGDYGAVAIAAYTVGVRVLSFSWIPGIGFSVASSTLVGEALGASLPRAAVRAGWRAARLGFLVGLVAGGLVVVWRAPLAALFTTDVQVLAALDPFMLILGVSQPLIAVHFALGGALRGAGDTVTPLWAAAVANWGLRLPFALVAARVLGADVIWMWNALVIDHIVRTIWLTISFHRGDWAKQLGASTNGG